MSELEQKLREYFRVNDSYCPCTPQEIKAFRAGAELLLPMLVEALSALEFSNNYDEECNVNKMDESEPDYQRWYWNKRILESINEQIKALASEYE